MTAFGQTRRAPRTRAQVSCFVALSACLQFAAASAFSPPDLGGYTQHSERDADGDGDGVKETHIVQYLNSHGDSIVSMSTGTHLWAWSLETRGDGASVRNYVIRDSDCDGVFDEVYSLDQEFHVPACVKKK